MKLIALKIASMNNTLLHIIRFVVLVALQAMVFSFLPLFTYALGFIYIFFILFLPMDWPKYVQLLLAFGIGLTIDFLTGTHGIHAIIAPILVVLREPILRLLLPKYNEEEWQTLDLYERDVFEFSGYAFIMSFVFSLLFYALNFFTTSAFPQLIFYVLASTIFTFILLFLYRYMFANTTTGRE